MATRAVPRDHLEKVESVQDRFQSDDNWVDFGLRVLCVWPARRLRGDELVQVSDAIVAFGGYSNEELSELSDDEIEMVDDMPGLMRQDKDRADRVWSVRKRCFGLVVTVVLGILHVLWRGWPDVVLPGWDVRTTQLPDTTQQVVSSGRRTYSKSEPAIHDTMVKDENITDTELHRWQVHLASHPKCQSSAVSIPMASTVQHLQDTLSPAHVEEQLSAIAMVDTALDTTDRRALGEVLFDQLTLAWDKLAKDDLVIGLRGEEKAANVGVQAFFRTLDLLDQVHSRSLILSSLLFPNASRAHAAGEDSAKSGGKLSGSVALDKQSANASRAQAAGAGFAESGGKLSWSVSLQKESASVVELLEDCAGEFVKSEEARKAL